MGNSEQIPFPDRLINWYDLAKSVGEIVFHSITDQLRHSTPSEHFIFESDNHRQIEIHKQVAALSSEETAIIERRHAAPRTDI